MYDAISNGHSILCICKMSVCKKTYFLVLFNLQTKLGLQ